MGLTCLASVPFYSSPPSLPQKQSFTDFLFSLWGFVSSIVLKRLSLPKWIGLVHHLFAKGSLFNRVHPLSMTSRLFDSILICPSQMNCTLLSQCSLPRGISARSCSHGRCVRSGARIWWIPPPRCVRSEHWKESSRLYSRDSQQALFFGVKSGVAF